MVVWDALFAVRCGLPFLVLSCILEFRRERFQVTLASQTIKRYANSFSCNFKDITIGIHDMSRSWEKSKSCQKSKMCLECYWKHRKLSPGRQRMKCSEPRNLSRYKRNVAWKVSIAVALLHTLQHHLISLPFSAIVNHLAALRSNADLGSVGCIDLHHVISTEGDYDSVCSV